MERIRIDRKALGLRARHRRDRDRRNAEASAPLDCAAGGRGPEVDEDLLARIDQLVGPTTEAA